MTQQKMMRLVSGPMLALFVLGLSDASFSTGGERHAARYGD